MRPRIDWAIRRMTHIQPKDIPQLMVEMLRVSYDALRRPETRSYATEMRWPVQLDAPPPEVLVWLRALVEREAQRGPECAGKRVPLDRLTEWHADPSHGHPWSRWPGPLVPYRFAPVDVLHTWHLHRLSHCARASLATHWGDAQIDVGSSRDQVTDWMMHNPVGWGIGWADALEVAYRVVSMLLIAQASHPRRPPVGIENFLFEAGRWLHRYPSQGSSLGNHTIGEAAALCLIGSCAPGLPRARRWRRAGVRRLERALLKVLGPDGLSREQSIGYTASVLEWALIADRAVGGLSPEVRQRLGATVRALSILCGDHIAPAIGDDDGAGVIDDGSPTGFRARSVANAGASILGIPGPRHRQPDLRGWLLGAHAPHAVVPRKGACFPTTGWSVLWPGTSSCPWHVVVGHGPLGLAPRMAHGHDDALSVWATLAGCPILVDRGTPTYNADDRQREWCRGAAAHAAPIVDGQPPAHPVGRFTWGSASQVGNWAWRPDRIDVRRRAYPDAEVSIHRTVRFEGAELVIEDRLLGRGTHHVALWWPLPPGTEVNDNTAQVPGGARVLIRTPEQSTLRCVPTLHADRYGHPTSAPSWRTTMTVTAPARLVTRWVPLSVPSAQESHDGEAAQSAPHR